MDMLSEFLSSKMESITSSLYSHISLWAHKLAHSPNNPIQMQYCNRYCYYYYGLETLVHSDEEKLPQRIVHRYNIASTETTTSSKPYSFQSSPSLSKLLWSPSSPGLRPTVLGDLLGAESGDYMSCDVAEEEQVEATKVEGQSQRRVRREMRSERKREFLPPITLMKQTGRMPWSFKREYNEYGRLIIKAEKIKCQEYVEGHRENCRLTMKLVVDDENTDCCEEEEEESGFEHEFEDEDHESGFELEFEESDIENESKGCMDLRRCVSYACIGTGTGEFVRDGTDYLGRPGSAPLQLMTPVI